MENQLVQLKTKPVKTKEGKDVPSKKRKFVLKQANTILNYVNSAWELDDPKWKWNGTELAKVPK